MKHFSPTLRSLLVLALLTGMGACRQSKTAMHSEKSGAKEVSTPFQGEAYRTSATHYRAVQSGTSPDLATARKIALLNAKNELAGSISARLRSVIQIYTDQRQVGNAIEFSERFQEISRQVIDQELTGVSVKEDKVFQRPDNTYECWVAVELPVSEVNNKLNSRISSDEKLRQDYNREQFLKIFDDEMRSRE